MHRDTWTELRDGCQSLPRFFSSIIMIRSSPNHHLPPVLCMPGIAATGQAKHNLGCVHTRAAFVSSARPVHTRWYTSLTSSGLASADIGHHVLQRRPGPENHRNHLVGDCWCHRTCRAVFACLLMGDHRRGLIRTFCWVLGTPTCSSASDGGCTLTAPPLRRVRAATRWDTLGFREWGRLCAF